MNDRFHEFLPNRFDGVRTIVLQGVSAKHRNVLQILGQSASVRVKLDGHGTIEATAESASRHLRSQSSWDLNMWSFLSMGWLDVVTVGLSIAIGGGYWCARRALTAAPITAISLPARTISNT